MTPHVAQRWLPVGIAAAAIIGGFVFLQFADPNDGGKFWPRCALHKATGLHCPGCGSTRAVHALAHGDLNTAMAKNGLLVISLPLLLVLGARQMWNGVFPEKPLWPGFRLPRWAVFSFVAIVVAYAVLRNLPAFRFLAPG